MDALRQTPGVTGAAFANQLPGSAALRRHHHLRGGPAAGCRSDSGCASSYATPDFFSTMRIPLRAGRLLNESDNLPWREQTTGDRGTCRRRDQRGRCARLLARARSPIGASARFSGPNGDRFEVVGVVGDVRNNGLNRPAMPELYLPAAVRA